MKATDKFKETIKAYLELRAKEDELFATAYAKPGKSIDDCITYILNSVKASGCNGFADEEIFGMAVHYYDEDNIKIGNPVSCNVVVNHAAEITETDRKVAHDAAMKQLQDEAYNSLKSAGKRIVKPKKEENVEQMNLFEL